MCGCIIPHSGSPVLVQVQLEREEEVTGPVIAPLFPQVNASSPRDQDPLEKLYISHHMVQV